MKRLLSPAVDDAALIARYHPHLAFHIAHGAHLATYLPNLRVELAALQWNGGKVAFHLAIIAHPDIAHLIAHQIVNHF